MNDILHPLDRLAEHFVQIHWLVYLVLAYCLFYGWWVRHPRVIAFYRLFLLPLLLGLWSLHSIFVRYALSWSHLSAWILFVFVGTLIGWRSSLHLSILADKHRKLIRLPGSTSTLIWIILIFAIRYYFGFIHVTHPESLKNPFYTYPDILLSATVIGFFLGRALHYTCAYIKAPHTDLHRSFKV
jgi:hypothetical protein